MSATWSRWICLVTCSTLLLWASMTQRVRADDTPSSKGETPTPRECTGRVVAGPAVGIPLGIGTATVGGMLIFAGTNPLGDSFGSDPKSNNARGAIAGGSILVAAGLAAFVYSAIKLRKNLEARRSVCGKRHSYEPLALIPNRRTRRVVFDGAGLRF